MAKYLDLTGLTRFWNSFKARLLPSGGSSGQVLVKASGTDYDVEWADHITPVVTYDQQTGVLSIS